MITRLRENLSRYTERIAMIMMKTSISPNTITALGLTISFLSILGAYLRYIPVVFIAVLVSSTMDLLDGALARVSGKTTKFGSIFDSFSDRVEEIVYLLSLKILGVPSLIVLMALAISFLISYLRALGEKYGIKVEGVGILERGERSILISIAILAIWLGCLWLANIVLLVLVALGSITVLQRLLHIYRNI